MSFPGRNTVSFPWGKIAIAGLVVFLAGLALVMTVKHALSDKYQSSTRNGQRNPDRVGPGAVRQGVDRVGDNVTQIFYGNPFENPKARVYAPQAQFPMSSGRGNYYKDRR